MTFNPMAYGSPTEPETLVKLIADYNAKAKAAKATGAKAAAVAEVKNAASATLTGENYADAAEAIAHVREIVFGLSDDALLALHLRTDYLLTPVLQFVKDYGEYRLDMIRRELKPTTVAADDGTKAELDAMRNFIHAYWSIGKNDPDTVKKITLNDKGEPKLERLPNGARAEGSAPTGRPSKFSMLRFRIDGIDVPAGTQVHDLCFRLLSTDTFRISHKQLRALVENTDKLRKDSAFFSPWKVTLEDGRTVEGWVPVEAAGMPNEDEDTDDTDENNEDEN